MRITIWLSIAVFVTTLYWPQLLNYSGMLSCVLSIFVFVCWPRWRYLAILPATALYFSLFSYVTLLGVTFDPTNFSYLLQNKVLINKSNQQQVSFIPGALSKQDNTITVQVKSLINTKNNGYFIANIISINNLHCNFCPLIEMRWFKPTLQVQAGQVHQFKVRLKTLQGKGNPASFDRQKWRYSMHIAYIANIKQHLQVIDSRLSLRAVLYQKVLNATHQLTQQGSILALVFADKSLMSDQDKQLIKQLGIAHLFAISGLHIGLLFVFSTVIFSTLVKKYLPARLLGWFSWRLVNIFGLCVCFSYAYISGFSLPTQRALLMLLISVLMLSSKRKTSIFDLLILCLWSILLFDPLAILSSSLWLSFTAMSAILIFVWLIQRTDNINKQGVSSWKVKLQQLLVFIKWLVLLQLVLTLFMLPIQLMNFSAVSTFALAINLIAIPLFSWFIIPLTLLGTLLLVISVSAGLLLLTISNYLLDHFLAYFEPLAAGYLSVSDFTISLILSILIFSFLLFFLYFLTRLFLVKNPINSPLKQSINSSRNKYINKKQVSLPWTINAISTLLAVICISFIGFIIIRIAEVASINKNTWQVEVFDVGQGLAVLVESNGEYLLYDTGPSYSANYAVATFTILPYLQARGVTHLDYLIISHSDNDHAGGMSTIQNNLDIKNAYAGEAQYMNELQIESTQQKVTNLVYKQCLTGQSYRLGKLTLTTLSPSKVGKNNNNNSCVIKASDGHNSLLLTGDISKVVEQKMINRALQTSQYHDSENLQADILIAPHHGSKTSSSITFIEQVDPSWVVFSAGYKNRWNFPILEVVERYQQQGIKHLSTSNTGFIRFNVENQHIDVKTFREDLAAYWYHQHLAF